MVHELKTWPKYFEEVFSGRKNFELRINDRDFKVGDILHLVEFDNNQYTGRSLTKRVTYIYVDRMELLPNTSMKRLPITSNRELYRANMEFKFYPMVIMALADCEAPEPWELAMAKSRAAFNRWLDDRISIEKLIFDMRFDLLDFQTIDHWRKKIRYDYHSH